jgi:hypothetical protein
MIDIAVDFYSTKKKPPTDNPMSLAGKKIFNIQRSMLNFQGSLRIETHLKIEH